MDIHSVVANFVVAAQMQPDELTLLASQGFAAVVPARPDGEEPGQPPPCALAKIRGLSAADRIANARSARYVRSALTTPLEAGG